jgi:glucokinase
VILLGDIGGTNARFALYDGHILGPVANRPVADFAGPVDAIQDVLAGADGERPQQAILAVAGPVEDGYASLTNGCWRFVAADLRTMLDLEAVTLVNDFAAQAHAIPVLSEQDLVGVGGGRAVPAAPAAVIGPGTGLGVAGLIPSADGTAVIVTEGGHVTMAPADADESRLVDHLRASFGHVSAERVLCGAGLVNLYNAIARLDGGKVPERTPEEITQAALAGSCPTSVRTLETFCAMLGTVAGNLALSLGAKGGVYIAGGIVPRIIDQFVRSSFRTRFEAKGRFRGYLAAIPTKVVMHPNPALLGLTRLVDASWPDSVSV